MALNARSDVSFDAPPKCPETPADQNELTNKAYVDAADTANRTYTNGLISSHTHSSLKSGNFTATITTLSSDNSYIPVQETLAPAWHSGTTYGLGSLVSYQGKVYKNVSGTLTGMPPSIVSSGGSSGFWEEVDLKTALVGLMPDHVNTQVHPTESQSYNYMLSGGTQTTVFRCLAQGGMIDLYLTNVNQSHTTSDGMLDIELWIPVVTPITSFYFGYGNDSSEVTWIKGSLESLTMGNTHIVRLRSFIDNDTVIYAEHIGSFVTPRRTIEVTSDSDAASHTGVSLRDALASATTGDRIVFSQSLGTTTIRLTQGYLTIPTGVEIDGDDRITIDGNNTYRIAEMTGVGVLTNLTLQNGKYSGQGGCIRLGDGAALVCSHCSFIGNNATAFGGVIYIGGTASVTAMDCVFTGNNAPQGAICYGSADLTFLRCKFTLNGGSTCKRLFHVNNAANFENCIINNNTAGASTYDIFYVTGDCTLRNCTICNNSGRVFTATTSVTPYIYNSVDVNNSAVSTGTIVADHVLSSFSGWASSGLIAYDSSRPLFDTDGYTPVSGSQVIGAGKNSLVKSDIDYTGNPRIVGTVVDLGAIEYRS